MATWKTQKANSLFSAILRLKNLHEAQRFFRDLLTKEEIREFSERWEAARLLDRKIPYTTIIRSTGLSSTTIARVQRWLQRGMNGYRLLIDRTKKNKRSAGHHTHFSASP